MLEPNEDDIEINEEPSEPEGVADQLVDSLKAVRDDAIAALPTEFSELPRAALEQVANEAIVGTLKAIDTEEAMTFMTENPGHLAAAYFDEINT